MALALNKSSLKQQRDQLGLFRKYLPSLDLKRQQLLAALKEARRRLEALNEEMRQEELRAAAVYPLLGGATLATRELSRLVRVKSVRVEQENLAGVTLPVAREVNFEVAPYSTLGTPFWVDPLIEGLRQMAGLRIRQAVEQRRVQLLDAASRRVTQRVNLFEKVLIPQAQKSIQRIQIFLADQERSAVVRSKIAKSKT
ncbi:V-type ATP synthase subunit D [Candidatus Laterigemmans baculatus]|uniref:V-type ATP synthase subunit D n=1 Tax=Candidatus Laterigemmans baculatus TaxID=2770505 RepID=UPI00193B5CE9|nr:V-type ATP synthase subunit D [Candidatus Laterigemmans baculatus]